MAVAERGGAVDDGHLAEELALAERHDDGLACAVDLGDLDLAVEHDKQLASGRAFLENDVTNAKFVDAFLDGHGVPRLRCPKRHVNREMAPANDAPRPAGIPQGSMASNRRAAIRCRYPDPKPPRKSP